MSENIIFLQNNDIWLEVMQLNTITGDAKILKRTDEYKISGHFGEVNNKIVMFYRKDKNLYLNLENREISLCDSTINLSFERIDKNNKFSINRGNDILYSVIYPSCIYDPLNIADFDFNSDREEDQDFFLFVYNVMQNKEWQSRIYF